MMRKLATLAVMIAMTGMIGCGFDPPEPEPQINELAKQTLPGTWSDPAGMVSITFDASGQITGIAGLALPEELAGLKFDGSTFDFTVPNTTIQLQAQLQLQVATVGDDGKVTIQYRGELVGFPDLIDPGYVQITVNGQLDSVTDPAGFSGSLSGVAYPSALAQKFANLPAEVSIAQEVTFNAVKDGSAAD